MKSSSLYFIAIIAVVAYSLLTRMDSLLSAVNFNLSNYEIFTLSLGDSLSISHENSFQAAQTYSDSALTFAPQSSAALFAKARLALLEQDFSSAGDYLLQVDRPKNQIVNWLTGYVLYQSGQQAAALEAWKRAGSARQIIELGLRASGAGDPNAAIALYQIAVQVDPNFPNAHYALGAAYDAQDNFNLAERSLLKALELSPNIWWYNLHLAQVYDRFDERTQAIHYYRIALDLNPSLENVKLRLAELDAR